MQCMVTRQPKFRRVAHHKNKNYDRSGSKYLTGIKANTGFFPAVNITAFDDRYEIAMALPGYKKEEVKITLEDDLLKVYSEESTIKDDTTYRRREFSVRPFTRHYRLPDTIDGDKVDAVFDRGILTIVLRKKEEAVPQPPKQINIH